MELENHPIPQDVSHFQFKLIGSMSVKQLGYVGAGCVLAWVFFSLPIFFLIKIPLVGLYLFLGILLAFIPIEGRPADLMLYYFIKALFEANQYIFHKESSNAFLSSLSQHSLIHQTKLLAPAQGQKQNMPTQKTTSPLNRVHNLSYQQEDAVNTPPLYKENVTFHNSPLVTPDQRHGEQEEKTQRNVNVPPSDISFEDTNITPSTQHTALVNPTKIAPIKNIKEMKKEEDEDENIKNLKTQDETLENEENTLLHQLTNAKGQEQTEGSRKNDQVNGLEEQLNTILAEKQKLEERLKNLTDQLAKPTTKQKQPELKTAQGQLAPQDKVLPKKPTSLITPDVPNLVTGIVRDARGNILPGILIEIKDNENNPVRAFKTNQLGQFASATPLLNGSYRILLEDSQNIHKFDTIDIIANGEIITPIEIISKDQREELRKSLFS